MTNSAFSASAPLAMVTDYDGLVDAMRLRADKLGVSTQVLDELAGLPAGYVGKLFGPGQVRQMGIHSFLLLAETLGLSVALHVDMDAVKRMEKRWEKRDEIRRRPNRVRLGPKARARVMREMGRVGGCAASGRLASDGMARIGAIGGRKTARLMTKKQRRERAKKAANARWNPTPAATVVHNANT